MLKPLSEPGIPFTVPVTVDHSVTSLFVLPEGPFYTVESLVLDAVSGVPLRPVVDYMYFQQDVVNSKITSKQIATIIQLRNKSFTNVVVKGKYSHGITQEQLDYWNDMTINYKDVPLWMNWIACLDDPLQVHPNVKRTVMEPPMSKRTLVDVECELDLIADQFINGDKLLTSHIEYWQQQLFLIAENQYTQMVTDLNNFLTKMKVDLTSKAGDFRFSDGDGVVWSNGVKNQFHGITLCDRDTAAIGSYVYLPEGVAIPARRTNLFQRVTYSQDIVGLITTNKKNYFSTDTVAINVNIGKLVNRVDSKCVVQIIDPTDEKLLKEFPINDFKVGAYNFNYNLQEADIGLFKKELIVRIPQYMWLEPAIINVEASTDPSTGYISVELLGTNNIGVIDGGGYVDEIVVKFKRVGVLKQPQRLYVHLSGDYTSDDILPGYPALQQYDFPLDFNESEVIVAKFKQHGDESGYMRADVSVSKTADPLDTLSVVAENTWYITKAPSVPYIGWHFAVKNGSIYNRVGSVEEGTDVYAVGKLSVDANFYPSIPQLIVTSNGVGSAIEGVDFIIDRSTLINIDADTVAYKLTLPLKPEQEIPYKFLTVKTTNSNVAELWIVDKVVPADITAYWSKAAILNAVATDWVSEDSTFYLHVKAPKLVDGTKLNVSLSVPEFYRPYLTFNPQVTIFGGIGILELKLDAPNVANPTQFIKMLITGPNINYTTLGVRVLDTKKPFYEIRFIVDGLVDAVNASEGSDIRCQVRCIKDPAADGRASVMLSGNAVTFGPDMDFIVPAPNNDILALRTLDVTAWTDILVNTTVVKTPMRLDHLTLTADVVFPVVDGIKMGNDTVQTLNLRK